MLDKQILGSLTVALAVAGYAPYFYSIFKRRTRPHMISWVIWGLIDAIGFAGMFTSGAGAGS